MARTVGNSDVVLINPGGSALGPHNAILSGSAVPYVVEKFPGPLSIKWMPTGWGTWETRSGTYRVDASVYLVLNHGQEYSLTIDLEEPRETFCPFFGAGFVEQAQRSLATADTAQLDDPSERASAPLSFAEQLVRCDDWVTPHLHRMHQNWRDQGSEWLAAQFYRLAEGLVRAHADQRRLIANVPATRPATRAEIARRLHRARDFMHAHFDESLSLTSIARVACLSPHHFHRLFRTVFGNTPHGYLSELRLERAKTLLQYTEQTVTEVCFAAGFQSLGSFSTLFRRAVGASPSRYRIAARAN